jgi:hypothetical protein
MRVIWSSFYDSLDLRFAIGLRRRLVRQETLYNLYGFCRGGARNANMAGDTGQLQCC